MKKRISTLIVLMLSMALVCGSICTVNAAKKFVVKPSSKTVYVGSTVKMISNVATKYKTSNKKVATVTAKGVVTGKKAGKATITATAKSNKKLKVFIKLTVKDAKKSVVNSLEGNTFAKDFGLYKSNESWVFVNNCEFKKDIYNYTNNNGLLFNEGNKFAEGTVCHFVNTLTLGKDDAENMPKFNGFTTVVCEGCGSATANQDVTFNGTVYKFDIASVNGVFKNAMDGKALASEPEKIDYIEVVQYYENGEYKVVVNGLAFVE